MSQELLEQRVAALESQVAELRRKIGADSKWWERVGRNWTPDELKAFDEVVEYGKYFRATGQQAPPGWRPGDPIPEPVYDE